jgi:hypothetical protein
MSDENQSFLLTLRDAAKNCPDVLTRKLIRDAADELHTSVSCMAARPSPENMRRLNGTWAKAVRVLSNASTSGDDNSRGGAMELPERMAA